MKSILTMFEILIVNQFKMKKLFITTVTLTLLLNTNLHSQAPKGNSCVDSSVAETNIAIVKAVADTVGEMAGTAAEFMEEQPEAEVALAVVEVGAEVVGLIADAFKDNQYGNPTPVRIPWSNLNSTPMEWYGFDGDIIDMYKRPGTGKLHFKQVNSDWWKGIVVFEKANTNKWYELMCLYNDQEEMEMAIAPHLADETYITLSKAKFAGVHSNMYLVSNWGEADTRFDYFFEWKKD